MRQLRIAVLLCGVLSFNSTICYSFLGDYGKADAAEPSKDFSIVQKDEQKIAGFPFSIIPSILSIPSILRGNQTTPTTSPQQYTDEYENEFQNFGNNKPTVSSLTGTWIGTGTGFTIDNRGCTAGYTGKLTIDGQDPPQHKFTVEQSDNQLSMRDEEISYSNSSTSGSSYTEQFQGKISGNRIIFLDLAPAISTINKQIGTVNETGDIIEGDVYCKTSREPATAKGTFTWKRLTPTYKLTIYVSGADNYPGTNIAEPGGHAWISLSDGQTTNYYSFAPQKLWQAPYSVIGPIPGSLGDAKGYKADIVKEYIITQEGFKKAHQAIVDWNDIYNLELHNCATFATTIGIASEALPSQDVGIFASINPASLGNYLREHGGKSH